MGQDGMVKEKLLQNTLFIDNIFTKKIIISIAPIYWNILK